MASPVLYLDPYRALQVRQSQSILRGKSHCLSSPSPSAPPTWHSSRTSQGRAEPAHCVSDLLRALFLMWCPKEGGVLTPFPFLMLSSLVGPRSPFLSMPLSSVSTERDRARAVSLSGGEGAPTGRRHTMGWGAAAWLCLFSKGCWQHESPSEPGRWWESPAFAVRRSAICLPACLPACRCALLSPERQGLPRG